MNALSILLLVERERLYNLVIVEWYGVRLDSTGDTLVSTFNS